MDSIPEWYSGRSILITGGTGFMGKVLVEKLLRTCPNIDKIYLLVRPKKGQKPEDRLKDILNAPLFDIVRKKLPNVLEKFEIIKGDIVQPNFGMSNEDVKTVSQNVSVVFHCAATVRFDEPLKMAVGMNIQGTDNMIKLCYGMKKLEVLVHLSTAYCYCNTPELEEKFYPPPKDLDKLMQCMECLDDDMMDKITPLIIGDRPNTYTFTKAMAESLFVQHENLPVVIIRPSIVTPTWKDPFPGWIDNLNGPTGLFTAMGKGLMRSAICDKYKIADFIPCDIPINVMICSAWYKAVHRPVNTPIYNISTGVMNPVNWNDISKYLKAFFRVNPLGYVLWYPGGTYKMSRLHNEFCWYLYQYFPAYIFDFVTGMMGKKKMMVKIQNKLYNASKTLEFFTTREWKFHTQNLQALAKLIPEEDKYTYEFDIKDLDWKEYFSNYFLGIRQFILKEDLNKIESAKIHLHRMKIVHYVSTALFYMGIWQFLFKRFGINNYVWSLLSGLITLYTILASKLGKYSI